MSVLPTTLEQNLKEAETRFSQYRETELLSYNTEKEDLSKILAYLTQECNKYSSKLHDLERDHALRLEVITTDLEKEKENLSVAHRENIRTLIAGTNYEDQLEGMTMRIFYNETTKYAESLYVKSLREFDPAGARTTALESYREKLMFFCSILNDEKPLLIWNELCPESGHFRVVAITTDRLIVITPPNQKQKTTGYWNIDEKSKRRLRIDYMYWFEMRSVSCKGDTSLFVEGEKPEKNRIFDLFHAEVLLVFYDQITTILSSKNIVIPSEEQFPSLCELWPAIPNISLKCFEDYRRGYGDSRIQTDATNFFINRILDLPPEVDADFSNLLNRALLSSAFKFNPEEFAIINHFNGSDIKCYLSGKRLTYYNSLKGFSFPEEIKPGKFRLEIAKYVALTTHSKNRLIRAESHFQKFQSITCECGSRHSSIGLYVWCDTFFSKQEETRAFIKANRLKLDSIEVKIASYYSDLLDKLSWSEEKIRLASKDEKPERFKDQRDNELPSKRDFLPSSDSEEKILTTEAITVFKVRPITRFKLMSLYPIEASSSDDEKEMSPPPNEDIEDMASLSEDEDSPLEDEKVNLRGSKGERAIMFYLDTRRIEYTTEKTFPDLKDKGLLRIDIFVPEISGISRPVCIEFDGDFPGGHFSPHPKRPDAHRNQVRRDKIKDKYIKDNNMILCRIPYTRFVTKTQTEMDTNLDLCFQLLRSNPERKEVILDPKVYADRTQAECSALPQ
jgi:hypothetical protein